MAISLFLAVRLPTLLAIWWRACFQSAAERRKPVGHPASFIVYRLDRLGDLVLTTPLLRELKRTYPNSRSTVVVQREFRSVLANNPNVDEILSLPVITSRWLPGRVKKLASAILLYHKRLRGRSYDVAVSPRWDTDEDLATFLCVLTDASHRIGYSEKASPAKRRLNRGFDKAFSVCLTPGPVRHEVLRNLAIAKAAGAEGKDSRLEIHLSDPDRESVSRWWKSVPSDSVVITLGVGAQHASRKWPLERYMQTVVWLKALYRVQPIILCAASEGAEALRLASELGNAIIVTDGIRDSCAVLERCHLFIGNDSGCAHLAAAMNCKTIVISRHPHDGDPNHSNSPVRFAPHCHDVVVLQPRTGLGTCDSGCKSPVPHCITQISVAQVVKAAQSLLNTAVLPRMNLPQEGKLRLHQSMIPPSVSPVNASMAAGRLTPAR
jgi:ADP-heptose:LPS heptosyltransferase